MNLSCPSTGNLMLNETDLQKQNWALMAHAKASSVLVQSKNVTDLVKGVCDAIVNQAPYILAWVGIAKFDAQKTVEVLGTHGIAAGYAEDIDVKWSADTPAGRGPTGTCIRTGVSVVIRDSQTDASFAPWQKRAEPYGIRSVIAVPIKNNEPQPLGALTIYASIPDAFGNTEIELFESLAKEIGFGLSSIEKQHALDIQIIEREQLHRELVQSLSATIEAISKTMESRDPYTAGHQKKVALISEEISRKMGWDDQRVQGLFLAGLVHDIGKIAIPAEILTKPSKLTEIEATLMRQHPNTGYEILKDIPSTWPLAKAVQQHHERLDGSGYPNGLKGDQIIPEALILAVADTLESMSSHRPYRPGLGIDKTLEYINQESGKTFDATIVNVVSELVRQKDFQLILGLP